MWRNGLLALLRHQGGRVLVGPAWTRSSSSSSSLDRGALTRLLTTPEMTQLLLEGGIDFRDCFERNQLVERLDQSYPSMPLATRERLDCLIALRKASPSPAAPAPHLGAVVLAPTSAAAPLLPDAGGTGLALFADEQYIVNLFQKYKPSVVHIACLSINRHSGMSPILNPEAIPRNFGSGFVWDHEGHIVTNYHVIHNAQTSQVTLSNNKKFSATLRGAEPDKDLAVLKIDAPASELFPVQLGLSHRLAVGQKVFAIGNPFGLDHTLTAGIVSGLGREMMSMTGHTIRDVVQTDASINPGNSGGPLLDSHGRLIGVNTAATSHPLTTAGFGFAIPSDTVRRIVNQLIKHGRVVRPGLGVLCMHDAHSAQLMAGAGGVVVSSVVPKSGAEQAGLRGVRVDGYGNIYLGDVIIRVGTADVKSVEDLVSYVETFQVGDQVPVTVRRYDSTSHLDRRHRVEEILVPLLNEAKSP